MSRKSPKERELSAKMDLALKYGRSSFVQVDVHDTMFHVVVGELADPYVRQSEIRTHMRIELVPEGSLEWLGEAAWYDTAWPHRASYFFKGDVFLKKSEEERHENGPSMATSPSDLGERVIEAFDDLVQRQLDNYAREASAGEPHSRHFNPAAIDDYVNTGVKAFGDSAVMAVDDRRGFSMLLPAQVPFYAVSNDGQIRMEVMADRDFDADGFTWGELGLFFEYWEVDLAHEAMTALGDHPKRRKVDGIGFDPDMAVKVATHLRKTTGSLLPLTLKRFAREIATAPVFENTTEGEHAAVLFSKVNRNEWDSEELVEALSGLASCAGKGTPLADFVISKGWEVPIPLFELLESRVKAFPYYTMAKEARAAREPAVPTL